MKIIIIGMPYFSKKIYEQLKEYDKENNYIYLNTSYNNLDKLLYIFHILNSDIVYMHGGDISGNSGTVNLALTLKKK